MKANILKILLAIAVGVITTACDDLVLVDTYEPVYVDVIECSENIVTETSDDAYIHTIKIARPKDESVAMRLLAMRNDYGTVSIGYVSVHDDENSYVQNGSDNQCGIEFEYKYDYYDNYVNNNKDRLQRVRSEWFDADIEHSDKPATNYVDISLKKNSKGEYADSIKVSLLATSYDVTFKYTVLNIYITDN